MEGSSYVIVCFGSQGQKSTSVYSFYDDFNDLDNFNVYTSLGSVTVENSLLKISGGGTSTSSGCNAVESKQKFSPPLTMVIKVKRSTPVCINAHQAFGFSDSDLSSAPYSFDWANVVVHNQECYPDYTFFITRANGSPGVNEQVVLTPNWTEWRTFEIVWKVGEAELYVDGQFVTETTQYIPTTQLPLVISAGNNYGQDTVVVDWVGILPTTDAANFVSMENVHSKTVIAPGGFVEKRAPFLMLFDIPFVPQDRKILALPTVTNSENSYTFYLQNEVVVDEDTYGILYELDISGTKPHLLNYNEMTKYGRFYVDGQNLVFEAGDAITSQNYKLVVIQHPIWWEKIAWSFGWLPKLEDVSVASTKNVATSSVSSEATTLEVCNGGLFGIEGSYTTNVSDIEVHYGDTIFVRVADGSGYSILVDGVNKGEDNAFFHVDKSSGTITIETSPATQTVTLNVTGYNGYMDYLAGYFLFVKSNCPALLNNLLFDTLLWALLIIPVGIAIGLKLGIVVLRAIL